MQKHILAIILAALMLLSLCACAKEDAEATPPAEELHTTASPAKKQAAEPN